MIKWLIDFKKVEYYYIFASTENINNITFYEGRETNMYDFVFGIWVKNTARYKFDLVNY